MAVFVSLCPGYLLCITILVRIQLGRGNMDTQTFIRQIPFKLPLIFLATLNFSTASFAEDPYLMIAGLERLEASNAYEAAHIENVKAQELYQRALHTKKKKDKEDLFAKMAKTEKKAEALQAEADSFARQAVLTALADPGPEQQTNFLLLIPLFIAMRQQAVANVPPPVVAPAQIVDLSALPSTLALPSTTLLK